jgi:nucleotide-binding universal stress UspA family protein
MTMPRILHPTDFSRASRAAYAKAVLLAKKDRSELLIAHVLPPVTAGVDGDGFMTAKLYQQLEEANRRQGQKQLDALVAQARKAGVRARGLLLEGVAHDRIARAARAQRADMIVMGTHGRTGLARFMLGSVASRVVSQARCPVLTVRGR